MRMKVIVLLGALVAMPALAQEYTRGYVRADGTYVQPHYSTTPDSTRLNNYSTQGNVNPYTGRAGTVNPYSNPFQVQPSTSRRSSYGGSSAPF